ncbi:hypothetical protein [Croceibacterium mercuriale]|uniref:hypothetical protein n=1 Tax=Croceibacterium mercuriale TaxID=1572751 RepID=UPI001F1F6B9F|nr:hypothetical protein [Croceibacterium mercuriale]
MALSACGPDEIASPGTGGNITINNPAPTPAPSPAPTPAPTAPALVQPASGCPTIADAAGLADDGVITGPTGTYRVCTMPARFTRSATLPNLRGVLYRMNGRVDVGTDGGPTASAADTNVVLTIDPGAIVFASGASFLNVNRGNRINAVGTAQRPIIFTSRDNVLGLNSDTSSGQWGGVVLSGRAQVTDCAAPAATPGTVACERQVEGAATPAFFGGVTNNDNSGRLSYVQIRYSGFVLSGNSELQSLTTGGTGSGTQMDHIMSFNSSDDGVEFFGGYVNMKHLIVVGPEDDALDVDTGVKANLQYVIVAQNTNTHDTILEGDSDNLRDSTPRTNARIANFTFIAGAPAADGQAMLRLRGGADFAFVNGLLVSRNDECLRVQHAETIAAANAGTDEAGPPIFRSVAFQCGGASPFIGTNDVTAAQVQGIFTSGPNNNANYTSTLTNLFVNGANESALVASNPQALSSFFDTTNYVGAVRDASDTWYAGWTCNSATASFGANNSGACTSLPVYPAT